MHLKRLAGYLDDRDSKYSEEVSASSSVLHIVNFAAAAATEILKPRCLNSV